MPSFIETRFGKSSDVTIADLETKLVGLEEDEQLEAKRVPRDSSDMERQGLSAEDRQIARRWGIEELAVSAIVGLLNKEDGSGGLLVLGARAPDGRVEALEPASNAQLDKLKLATQAKVASSSNPLAPFERTFVRVPASPDTSVDLVEVRPRDRTVVYYSAITSLVYRREGDSTQTLPPREFVRLVESRRIAKVLIQVTSLTLNSTPTGKELLAKLRFLNLGNTPARFVCSVLRLDGPIDPAKVSLRGRQVTDESERNIGPKKTYSITAGYPPASTLLYPLLGVVLPDLHIPDFPDKEDVTLTIETYEDKGATRQIIIFRREAEKISATRPEPTFTPY